MSLQLPKPPFALVIVGVLFFLNIALITAAYGDGAIPRNESNEYRTPAVTWVCHFRRRGHLPDERTFRGYASTKREAYGRGLQSCRQKSLYCRFEYCETQRS